MWYHVKERYDDARYKIKQHVHVHTLYDYHEACMHCMNCLQSNPLVNDINDNHLLRLEAPILSLVHPA